MPHGSLNHEPDKNAIFCYTHFFNHERGQDPEGTSLHNSFGIETINTFIHSLVPSKTIPDSRPKWAKSIPVLRLKRRKNPTELYNEKTNNTKRKPASTKGIFVDIYFSELVRIIFLECSIFQEQ